MGKRTWVTEGYEGFRQGTFGNGGQNLYVSKRGVLQRIFQYDLNRDGYADLVFANCQNHHEAAPAYVYTMDGRREVLPAQGSLSGFAADLDGDGWPDLAVCGHYDMAAPYASTDIYFGSPEGYSEKYRIRVPTPFADDGCSGDFRGTGKPALAFVLGCYHTLRIFEQTDAGFEWDAFADLPLDFDASLIACADLDGDGYDDLILRAAEGTETVVLWGGPEGVDPARRTVLPALPDAEVIPAEKEDAVRSETERGFTAVRLLQTMRWNGKNCFTLSTGKKLLFYTANPDRTLTQALSLDVPMALAAAVGDLDGDGYDDIAVACTARDADDPGVQHSFILWNGPGGPDRRPRTVIPTHGACDVKILDGSVLFCQCAAGNTYTNDSLLYTYPDFTAPRRFEGEDPRRCALLRTPDGALRVVLFNHYARSSIGFEESYVYFGGPDGFSPERRLSVPSHCAVDALIADLDDDGYAELLIGNNSENSIHLDHGHDLHFFGQNGFEPERSRRIRTDIGWGVCAGDFDHDGYLEIVTPGDRWKELRIYSARDGFRSWTALPLDEGASARWPGAFDLNGDGWLDLVVPCCRAGARIFWGGPEGYAYARSQRLAARFAIACTAADLTKNGYLDLIVGGHTDTPSGGELTPHQPHHSFVYIYWGGPGGYSESRKCVLRGDAADSFAVADFNNDGWLDIFAGSYHGGKDRDVNSFLYWNREGRFRELDRDLLYTHSASGCMAADFNGDGYIDLAVANHKVDGDHHGYSSVWWNGPGGFSAAHRTDLPTDGPHGMISSEIGNIADRGHSEYYTSAPFTADADCSVTAAAVTADIPPKTAVRLTARTNGGAWTAPEGIRLRRGDVLEYRLELYAYNCLRTPRVTRVTIELTEE